MGLYERLPLIRALAWREIEARYKGSHGGLAWYVIQTLLTVAIYSFVFGTIFRSRWAEAGKEPVNFTMALFIGLLVFNLFSESIGRASMLIVGNANYVKKIVFPLEILPIVALLVSLFNLAVGVVVFLGMAVVFHVNLFWAGLWVPIILLPLLVMLLGAMWFLASVGTFVRDTPQFVGLATVMFMFLSPLFYPAEMLPIDFRSWIILNPLTLPMEQARKALLFGEAPNLEHLAIFSVIAVAFAALGYLWFAKTRKAFADVL